MIRVLDWRAIFVRHGIEFVERGANVRRGEMNIRCPMCGSADPSHHMGVSPETGWWACWRNSAHRGKSPVRLLVALLRVSVREARELAGLDEDWVDPEGFTEAVARFMGRVSVQEESVTRLLDFPSEFRPLQTGRSACRRHVDYLESRHFRDIDDLSELYELCYAVSGPWRDRVVLPYITDGQLVAWTGRAVTPRAEIRYKDLSVSECVCAPKHTLFNHDVRGDTLVVVEGPVDALKLDFYGRDHGLRAVALSTNSISEDQIYLLHGVSQHFRQVLVMMDMATRMGVVDSMKMRQKLSGISSSAQLTEVPFGRKDAGELTPEEVWVYAAGVTL